MSESNLVALGGVRDFNAIYRKCLIDPLHRAASHAAGAHVQLMLSTPAYGFGAVDEDEFNEFMMCLSECTQKCKLDLILHTPEIHWAYWANILLWSASRQLLDNDGELPRSVVPARGDVSIDAIRFAQGICRFHRAIWDAPETRFQMWLGNNVNMRMFSYRFTEPRPEDIVYVANADAISLTFAQFGEDGFNAVASRIAAHSLEFYVNESASQFERQKLCHYLNDFDPEKGPERGRVAKPEFLHLLSDYVFGRTAFPVGVSLPDRGTDHLELVLHLIWRKTRRLMMREREDVSAVTEPLLVKHIAAHALLFFRKIVVFDRENSLFGLEATDRQALRLKEILEHFAPPEAPCGLEEHFWQALLALDAISSEDFQNNQGERERIFALLQGLLTSGVRLSHYGENRIERAKAELGRPKNGND